MPIEAVSTQRLYQQVADRLAALIHSGEFPAGSRLPPERDLARQFAVSRPTVREALIALEINGLVEVRTGAGTYICTHRPRQDVEPGGVQDAGPSAFEVITARRLVEAPVAGLAATTAGEADLARLREAVELFERQGQSSHRQQLEADQVFHLRLAEATHNAVMVAIVEDLWQAMFSPIFAMLSARSRLPNPESMTLHDHRVIFGCIERRDAKGAEAAMTTHLVHAELKLQSADSP